MTQTSRHKLALVRVQNPIQLSQYSEPEPDIAVVCIDLRKYIAIAIPHPIKSFY
ncbi:MAG: hypothetical protein V7L31_27760 [Nostoc sp.]|uniref:hypothetical protein n=1 Tax=Nostoc sp. TaxID=1180 RepID=UPI002FF433C4